MTSECRHRLCELIGDHACHLTTRRSRGCQPGLAAKTVAPAVFDEVRGLLAVIETSAPAEPRDERVRDAAVRLAAIIRREALDDRHLLAHARSDEPDLAPALERLCTRPK